MLRAAARDRTDILQPRIQTRQFRRLREMRRARFQLRDLLAPLRQEAGFGPAGPARNRMMFSTVLVTPSLNHNARE